MWEWVTMLAGEEASIEMVQRWLRKTADDVDSEGKFFTKILLKSLQI